MKYNNIILNIIKYNIMKHNNILNIIKYNIILILVG